MPMGNPLSFPLPSSPRAGLVEQVFFFSSSSRFTITRESRGPNFFPLPPFSSQTEYAFSFPFWNADEHRGASSQHFWCAGRSRSSGDPSGKDSSPWRRPALPSFPEPFFRCKGQSSLLPNSPLSGRYPFFRIGSGELFPARQILPLPLLFP